MTENIPKIIRKLLILLLFVSVVLFALNRTYSIQCKFSRMIVQHTEYKKKAFKVKQNDSGTDCTQKFRSNHFMNSDIRGRLGNQLFQVSTLIAAANDSCYTPFLNIKLGMDEYFNIHNIVRTKIKTTNFKIKDERGWGIYAGPIAKQISPKYNWTVKGSRECFMYFIHKSDLVRSSIVFKQEIKDAVSKYFEENDLFSRTKIGIHVRRGDFTFLGNVRLGFVVSTVHYIKKAMAYFENDLVGKDLAFLVVSDNIKWCKDNIKAPNIYFSPFKDPGRDFHILTQCDHNIVTVGTFGWMGAWLNETGTVIYDKSFPRVNSTLWRKHRNEDVYPDWWIGM